MEALYLTEVRRQPAVKSLHLTWSDGHGADFDYALLRGFCPCAACQGHGSGRVEYHRPPGPVMAESVSPVGNYAISIAWSDAHSTGIYRFDFLRGICPCIACVDQRGDLYAPYIGG